jgi:hypothetical protein
MRGSAIAVTGLMALLASAAYGQSEDYFIICEINRTYDTGKGRAEPTAGSDTFAVSPQPDGSTTYSLPFPCDEGTMESSVNKTTIWFQCAHTMDGMAMERFALIDRVSGEYQKGFAIKGAVGGLVHLGICRRTAARRF